jgi:hypothetical protein
LQDSQLRAQFVAGSSELSSRLGWQEPLEQMESLYAKLIKPSNSDASLRPVD